MRSVLLRKVLVQQDSVVALHALKQKSSRSSPETAEIFCPSSAKNEYAVVLFIGPRDIEEIDKQSYHRKR